MKSLGMAILMFAFGGGAGWAVHEFANRVSGYGEAEMLQPNVSDAMELPPTVRTQFGKMLLHDPNGDRVVIVNGAYQLRATAGKKPTIEPLGTQ